MVKVIEAAFSSSNCQSVSDRRLNIISALDNGIMCFTKPMISKNVSIVSLLSII